MTYTIDLDVEQMIGIVKNDLKNNVIETIERFNNSPDFALELESVYKSSLTLLKDWYMTKKEFDAFVKEYDVRDWSYYEKMNEKD